MNESTMEFPDNNWNYELDELYKAVKAVDCEESLLELLSAFAAAKSRLRKDRYEMSYAWEVVQALLPPAKACIDNYEMAGLLIPARDVGGDVYDFFQIDAQRLGFLLADAAGKGTGPCIQAATCRAYFRALASKGSEDLEEIASQLNRLVFADLTPEKFLTACFGWIDLATDSVEYVTAGHGSGFFVSATGVEQFQHCDLPLGVFAEADFSVRRGLLDRGDLFCLFTDGWTERLLNEEEEYGEERLSKSLTSQHAEPAEHALRKVFQDYEICCRDFPAVDDVTALFLQRCDRATST